MIYVSTTGASNSSAVSTAKEYIENEITSIELSAGKYTSDATHGAILLSKIANVAVHNYYPVPAEPFVLNLATENDDMLNISMQHVIQAMQLSVQINNPIYSVHAGFRVNPGVGELGSSIKKRRLQCRKKSLAIFKDSVVTLSRIAESLGVTLMVENNVINRINYEIFGENPLLLTDPSEISEFFEEMPSNVKLLMDVGHLNVSANTQGFDRTDALVLLNKYVFGYHLSDNNGDYDTNSICSSRSWFAQHLNKEVSYVTVEVNSDPLKLREIQKDFEIFFDQKNYA